MVTTVRLPGSKKHPLRYVTFIKVTPAGKLGGVVEIRCMKSGGKAPECFRYAIRETEASSQEERAFRLTKPGGETYYGVCLCGEPDAPRNDDRSPYDSCDCIGFEQYGRCKHVEALRALLEAGHLDPDLLPSVE
jgi:hypothetical protein